MSHKKTQKKIHGEKDSFLKEKGRNVLNVRDRSVSNLRVTEWYISIDGYISVDNAIGSFFRCLHKTLEI